MDCGGRRAAGMRARARPSLTRRQGDRSRLDPRWPNIYCRFDWTRDGRIYIAGCSEQSPCGSLCALRPFEGNASLLAVCSEVRRRRACALCLHVYASEEGVMLLCLNCQGALRAEWKQEQEALLEQLAQHQLVSEFAVLTNCCSPSGGWK
ncbi:hypothetical protein N9L68_05845 [bacterium]|nr:hypothetical protein [bacterium]